MKFDKDLKFAEKYNWWSGNKSEITKKSKLSYIMSKGSLEELYFIFTNFDSKDLSDGFNLIKNDTFSLKNRRKNVIKTLFEEKNGKMQLIYIFGSKG